jgi:hydrogenase 3 maturation protease
METKPMWPPCWKKSLRNALRRLPPDPNEVSLAQVSKLRKARVAVVGVGHELRGDDAAGLFAARRLIEALRAESASLLVFEAGPAPENHTGALRQFEPDLVLFVDAAGLEAESGTVRWVDLGDITGLGASTHTLPLSTLAGFLTTQLGCDVALIGVQPGETGIGAPLSPPVSTAVEEIVRGLVEVLVLDEWEVFPREAATVGIKPQEQGVAQLLRTHKDQYEHASGIIRRSRDLTRMMMDEGFIPEAPEGGE